MRTPRRYREEMRERLVKLGLWDERLGALSDHAADIKYLVDCLMGQLDKDQLLLVTRGSMGQEKRQDHPLLVRLNDAMATLTKAYVALGLGCDGSVAAIKKESYKLIETLMDENL